MKLPQRELGLLPILKQPQAALFPDPTHQILLLVAHTDPYCCQQDYLVNEFDPMFLVLFLATLPKKKNHKTKPPSELY